MKSTVALLALAAGANAANYVWQGRPTNFRDPLNWDVTRRVQGDAMQYNPASRNRNEQPGSISIGSRTLGTNIVSEVEMGTYTVGSSITFDSATTLILGDGRAGSVTTLNFDTQSRNPPITFQLDNQFDCPNNWEAPENNCEPDDTDCSWCSIPTADDTISLPNTAQGNYVIRFGVNDKVNAVTGSTRGQCDVDNLGIWSTQPAGFGPSLILTSPRSCAVDATATSGNSVCRASNTCEQTDDETARAADQAAADQAAADQAAAEEAERNRAASNSADGDSSSTIIIVVVIALIIILGVVAGVVVFVKKNAAGGSDDRGQVSFENPMYDQAGQPQQEGQANAMYAQPGGGGGGGGGASGYMDVPAGGDGFGGDGMYSEPAATGYMDVAPGGGGATGYMDVSPGANGMDFGDDDDDAEDV